MDKDNKGNTPTKSMGLLDRLDSLKKQDKQEDYVARGIPQMPKPKIPHTEHTLKYYDGFTRTVYTTDEETLFPEGYLIVSRTNLKGIITHANEAFVHMSGWNREDLIGVPHSILRHPDLPKVAFKGLWDDVQSGKKWHGYVKNLRKDGGFYWVYATIIPNVRNGKIVGYTSVRRQPSREKIKEMQELYKQLKAQE